MCGFNIVVSDPLYVSSYSLDFDDFVTASDIISLHCPLTEETKGMINKNVFDQMKDTACLVNTARGPIVDQGALINALREGSIRSACIDVTEEEPPCMADLDLPNLFVSPHGAFYSEESLTGLKEDVITKSVEALYGM